MKALNLLKPYMLRRFDVDELQSYTRAKSSQLVAVLLDEPCNDNVFLTDE